MTQAENERAETKHDQGKLKNRKEKRNKRKLHFPSFNHIPLGRVLMLSKVLGRQEGYPVGIRNAILGILLQGNEKEAQILYLSSSGSPLSVMFLVTRLKNKHMAPQIILISEGHKQKLEFKK